MNKNVKMRQTEKKGEGSGKIGLKYIGIHI